MLHEFLANNRDGLIERCRAKVAQRPARAATSQQLQNGVPKFLEQLIATLKVEQTRAPMGSEFVDFEWGVPFKSEIGNGLAQVSIVVDNLINSVAQVKQVTAVQRSQFSDLGQRSGTTSWPGNLATVPHSRH